MEYRYLQGPYVELGLELITGVTGLLHILVDKHAKATSPVADALRCLFIDFPW